MPLLNRSYYYYYHLYESLNSILNKDFVISECQTNGAILRVDELDELYELYKYLILKIDIY